MIRKYDIECQCILKCGSRYIFLAENYYKLTITGLKQMEANPDAKRLYDDLLSNYNRLIRPVINNTETLTVRLGLKLSQLIEVHLFLTFISILIGTSAMFSRQINIVPNSIKSVFIPISS